MSGVPCRRGVVATVLITGSRANIGVCRPDVLLAFISLRARIFRQSVERLCVFMVASATAAWSVLARCHRRLDGDTVTQARWGW
jgi:hypothetical protein